MKNLEKKKINSTQYAFNQYRVNITTQDGNIKKNIKNASSKGVTYQSQKQGHLLGEGVTRFIRGIRGYYFHSRESVGRKVSHHQVYKVYKKRLYVFNSGGHKLIALFDFPASLHEELNELAKIKNWTKKKENNNA